VTPRISPAFRVRRRPATSFEQFREDDLGMPLEQRAFWNWATAPADLEGTDLSKMLPAEEYRVLSKGASGGGFLVPDDVSEMVVSAARAASVVSQLAFEVITERGETLGMSLAATAAAGAWVAESGAYTPVDTTVTQQNLGAFKAATKIIASEELRTDSAVELDAYLAFELGGRLGSLIETATVTGDGSGKPLGLVHASSPYTVSTAPTGNTTAFSAAAIQQFYLALPAAYRTNASWLIAADDFGKLAGLTGSGGALVFPSLQFDPPSMWGRPVYISADLPAPAVSAKSLVFGDFKRAYGIRRVRQIGMQRQDELHADTGGVGYKLFARVDGRPLLSAAAIIGAHSAT
jgi:HK97 family phage major capsid protein